MKKIEEIQEIKKAGKTLKSQQSQINRSGRLSASRNSYIRRNINLFGTRKTIPASKTIAAHFAKSKEEKPKSTLVTVGNATPEGFGKVVMWNKNDKGLALVAFLNAGDPNGVMIAGVKATDTIQFVSATGIATFDEATANKGVGAFIGIIAAGADVTASAFGQPELAPVINSAAKFAQEMFKEEEVKIKRRDSFGVDPGTGHKARAEGGIIISMPAAGQIFSSGNRNHKDRWIKKPGVRDNAHRPSHVHDAFFLQHGHSNIHRARTDGDIIIAPWDWKFEDNVGFYRLHILLKRGDGKPPVVD